MQCKAKKGQAPTHPKLLFVVNQFPKQNALYQKSACDKLIIMLNKPTFFFLLQIIQRARTDHLNQINQRGGARVAQRMKKCKHFRLEKQLI